MTAAEPRLAMVLILAHGSTINGDSAKAALDHARVLDARNVFAGVTACFWKQEPHVQRTLSEIQTPAAVIVPFFAGAGYFVETVIPEALGLKQPGQSGFARVVARHHGTWRYCHAVGTHPRMTNLLLWRAQDVVQRHPFPRAPLPSETSLVVAGHGTERTAASRRAVEEQVARIRELDRYAEVLPAFMEEAPRIADCVRIARSRHVVVVPFFMSDGLHVVEDIPVLLGESEQVVRGRIGLGQWGWRNPTERQGRLVWYAPAVGTEPRMTDVILDLVTDALTWPVAG